MVKSESFSDVLFLGSRYAQHPLGGIRHKIYLFCVPELNIASLHVSTVFDKEFSNATMQVMLDIANESSYIDKTGRVLEKEVEDIRIGFELRDPEGRLVNIGTKDIKVSSIKSWQTLSYQVNIPVKAPKKWDPEHPNLYVLSCQLKAGGKKLQTSRQRFGFRQIEVRGNRLLVNGMPVKLRGIARHETHPILGRSLTPEMAREEVELYRKANINYIRTSHYPQAEEFMDMCDSLGMFVEEEAPICHVAVSYGHSTLWKKTHCFEPKYREAIVRPALEMVQRDRSHPSVILWSLGNES